MALAECRIGPPSRQASIVSGVTFMSAATVDLIIRARQVLERQSRSLTLQAPSKCAKRVLDLCGVA